MEDIVVVSDKNYWFYIHRDIYTYIYTRTLVHENFREIIKTAHYGKEGIVLLRKRDACFHVQLDTAFTMLCQEIGTQARLMIKIFNVTRTFLVRASFYSL